MLGQVAAVVFTAAVALSTCGTAPSPEHISAASMDCNGYKFEFAGFSEFDNVTIKAEAGFFRNNTWRVWNTTNHQTLLEPAGYREKAVSFNGGAGAPTIKFSWTIDGVTKEHWKSGSDIVCI